MVERDNPERALVGIRGGKMYFVPARMEENSSDEVGRINLLNVFAGLQKFQACNNEVGGLLNREQKIAVLSEIFKEPNDLIDLARVVELQTGIEGLIKTFIGSYSWAEWKINPHISDVTENIGFKHHIGVSVSIGEHLRAEYDHSFELENENGNTTKISDDRILDTHETDQLKVNSELRILKDNDEIESEEDEHGVLPEFILSFVEVLPGKKIRLEGTEDIYDEDDLEPERMFLSYILTENGQLEFTFRKKIDRIAEMKKLANEAVGPFSILPIPSVTDRNKVKSDLQYPLTRKALLHFILPYCDMPTTDGHFYVLDEDFILPDGARLGDQNLDDGIIVCREEDLEL